MKRLFQLIVAGSVALAPMAALAAIDGTHHDMPAYLNNAAQTKCAYCHSISLGSGAVAGLGQVGTFCSVVCHDAGVITQAVVGGPGLINPADFTTTAGATGVAVLAGSHGMNKTLTPLPDAAADITGTGWPHTNGNTLQCTSCHAVHDGTNPPFLNAALGTGNNATAFCNRCHTGSAKTAAQAGRYEGIATMGAHPTEFAIDMNGAAAPTANAAKGGRSLGFKAPLLGTVTAAATVAAFNTLDVAAGGNIWKTGGHFQSVANNMPTAIAAGATLGCSSCHSAHQNDIALGAQLLLGSRKAVIAGIATPPNESSVICVSCHGLTADRNNPGDTGYSHPANEQSGTPYAHNHADHGAVHPNIPDTGSFPLDVPASLAGISTTDNLTANDVGTNGEVLCVACHDVHAGIVGQMAIRQIAAVAPTEAVCEGCHSGGTMDQSALTQNWHHPSGAAASVTGFPAPAWGANLTDGLGCGDCHVFGGTAHNW